MNESEQSVAPAKTTITIPSVGNIRQKIQNFHQSNPKTLPVIGVVIVVVALLAILVARGVLVVAMVNGQPIYRHQIVQIIESQYGKDTLDTLILETVVQQELDAKNVQITEEDFAAEMSEIDNLLAEQGQSLQDYLAFQGIPEESFRKNVLLNMRIRKMLEQEVVVTDDEVNAYIEENKDLFSGEVDTDSEDFRASIYEQLSDQKINERASAWVDNLRSIASIRYFKTY